MKYIIVKVQWPEGTKKLSERVQEKIEEGYKPVGGMSTWDDKLYHRCFSQAMVKLGGGK